MKNKCSFIRFVFCNLIERIKLRNSIWILAEFASASIPSIIYDAKVLAVTVYKRKTFYVIAYNLSLLNIHIKQAEVNTKRIGKLLKKHLFMVELKHSCW